MSETIEGLRRQIASANDLQSVVHMMKVIAASNVTTFARAAEGSAESFRTLELGLVACFRSSGIAEASQAPPPDAAPCAIVFGSDQGLVGRFNETLAEYARTWMAKLCDRVQVFSVGDRMAQSLTGSGSVSGPAKSYAASTSLGAISGVLARVLADVEQLQGPVWVFRNRPLEGGGYEAASQRILPLDREWQESLAARPWPTSILPEVIDPAGTLASLVSDYLYLSLFRTCAESMASENAARLIAMQRADKNISDLLSTQTQAFNRLRQSSIDEELFDVVAGYEAVTARK